MAYINSSTHDHFVELYMETLPDTPVDTIFDPLTRKTTIDTAIGTEGNETGLKIPALTEVTVNATPGLYRWKQLDELSEYVITTASTNSLGMSLVVDPVTFFGTDPTSETAEDIRSAGIFKTTNNKHLCAFRLYWSGSAPEGDDAHFVEGVGYMAGLAPTTNPDAPVWVSPVTIEVAGDYITGKIDAV
jgi:hypothetical protein